MRTPSLVNGRLSELDEHLPFPVVVTMMMMKGAEVGSRATPPVSYPQSQQLIVIRLLLNADFMASSIHAIYRPVARSNRGTPATARPNKGKSRLSVPTEGYFSPTSESEAPDELDDLEEESHEDFDLAVAAARPPPLPLASKYDPTAPSPAMTSYSGSMRLLTPEGGTSPAPLVASPVSGIPPKLNLPNRQDSLATVRMKRKARLAEKLREVFGLREVEEVIAEMPCWLLRSVLLQGYMYLTSGHLCFFAHMPAREVRGTSGVAW